jgi:iron complex outermembrane receptor protein
LCTSKHQLDVDLGYVSNDRSEFEDSDVAGLQMKLNTFNYNAKSSKVGAFESIIGVQGMHQTNVNSGDEYLIQMLRQMTFGTGNYEWGSNVVQAGLRFDNRQVTSIENGYLAKKDISAIDRSFHSLMLL